MEFLLGDPSDAFSRGKRPVVMMIQVFTRHDGRNRRVFRQRLVPAGMAPSLRQGALGGRPAVQIRDRSTSSARAPRRSCERVSAFSPALYTTNDERSLVSRKLRISSKATRSICRIESSFSTIVSAFSNRSRTDCTADRYC